METLALMSYVEIDLSCLLLLIYIMVKSHRNFERQGSWLLYRFTLCFITLFVVSDLTWVLMDFDVLPSGEMLLYLINTIYFIFSVLASSFWFFFTESEMGGLHANQVRLKTFAMLPALLMIFLLIVSYFNGCMFSFDEEGHYVRGPLYLISFAIPLAYLVVATIHPFCRMFQQKYYIQRTSNAYLSAFSFITIVSGLLQIFLPGTPLPCLGITAASLLVYLNNQELMISLDPLTKLNNRSHMVRHLNHKMEHLEKNQNLFLLLLDLDRFKHINDTYGHVEGDNALIRLAGVLKKAAAAFNCFVARYGGDEFIIVFETGDELQVDRLRTFIHQELRECNRQANKDYDIETSIGCAKFNDNIQYVPEFIALADASLYAEKQRRRRGN